MINFAIVLKIYPDNSEKLENQTINLLNTLTNIEHA